MLEGLGGQALAGGQVEAAALDRQEHVGVPGGAGDDRDGGWFLAAARTMEGPPMSICSTHSSGVAPEATVSRNG